MRKWIAACAGMTARTLQKIKELFTGGFGAGVQRTYAPQKKRNEAGMSFSINKTVRRWRNEAGICKITQVVNPKNSEMTIENKGVISRPGREPESFSPRR